MKANKLFRSSLLALSAFLLTHAANATPVGGFSAITGTINMSNRGIQFGPTFVAAPDRPPGTGSFAGLAGGTIQSLVGELSPGNVNVPNFTTFSSGIASPIFFDLTAIAGGSGTEAGCSNSIPGSLCTPRNSPLTFYQLTFTTVSISIGFVGNSYSETAATGVSYTYAPFVTQPAVSGTIPQLLNLLQSGGTITGTYSGTFSPLPPPPPVPEPSTMMLMGVGLLCAGFVARRMSA